MLNNIARIQRALTQAHLDAILGSPTKMTAGSPPASRPRTAP